MAESRAALTPARRLERHYRRDFNGIRGIKGITGETLTASSNLTDWSSLFAQVPSCLILQMPRFGSKYKMYDMILPDLELDVTHIVENGKYFSKLALVLVLSSFLSFFHSFSGSLFIQTPWPSRSLNATLLGVLKAIRFFSKKGRERGGGRGKHHNIFSLALLLQIAPVELRCLLSLFFYACAY